MIKRKRKPTIGRKKPAPRIWLYFFIPLILVGATLWYWRAQIKSLVVLPAQNVAGFGLQAPRSLNNEEFSAIRAQLFSLVDNQNPKVALVKLNELSKTNPSVLASCHAFVHEIGHEAFAKYNDVGRAISYQDELCGSGYLHGVIEAYFKNTPDILEKMKTLCASYGLSAVAQRCYHALGHGLMFYTENDLPGSVQKCNVFTGKAKKRCLEGVYMENFNTDQKLHPSAYLKPNDPFYPCKEQPSGGRTICYFYAPMFHLALYHNDYKASLDWCATAPKSYISSCTTGLATRVMKQNIDNPTLVEKFCMGGAKDQVTPCIDGMVSYYVVNFDSWEKAQQMCAALQPNNQPTCQGAVNRRKPLF